MNLLSERLKWATAEEERRRGHTIRPADLARAAKTSNTSVNYWLTDVNGIGAVKARLLGEFLHVNPLWLETGVGTPEAGQSKKTNGLAGLLEARAETADELRLLSIYRLANEREREAIDDLVNRMGELIEIRSSNNAKRAG